MSARPAAARLLVAGLLLIGAAAVLAIMAMSAIASVAQIR
jgi:hypothetical protein